jgi:hypothetical protein
VTPGRQPTMKVLIAIDSSPSSQRVLEEAAVRPWPAGTNFSVVHVVDIQRFAPRAQTGTSVIVEAAGKIWLMSLSPPGQRSNGGQYVAEVGL